MAWFAVDARDGRAQKLAPDAKRDCPNMSERGRFQYVEAGDGGEAIRVARERYRGTASPRPEEA